MKKLIQLLAFVFLLCLPVMAQPAPLGYVTVTGSHITDASGNPEANGTIYFAPVNQNGSPLSFRVNGDGQAMSTPISATVTNGAFSLNVADTNLTFPANPCLAVTVVDNVSGAQLLGSGYGCVQPANNTTQPNNWCANGTCNFDNYPPALPAQTVTTAPNISIGTVTTGAPGAGAAASVSGIVPNFKLNLTIPQGNAATVGINSVTTCPNGTPATVTNSGTSSNALLNFCVPAGAPGTVTANGVGGNFSVSGTAINGKTQSQLPRIDVTYPSFGTGTCNNVPADPTGVNDSTCAINAAIAFDAAQNGAGFMNLLYFPAGVYKITSALRVPCNMDVSGDAASASVIDQYTNTANGVTVYNGGVGLIYECAGSLSNLTIESNGSHLHTATLLEVNSDPHYKTSNLHIVNSGGRGVVLNGSSERMDMWDTEVDVVRYPMTMDVNTNEDHFYKFNVAGGGQAADGYCFGGLNCPNGVEPNRNWSSAQTLEQIQCTGGTCTFVVQGGNSGTTINGDSPLAAVGAYFTIAGVPDLTGVNGTWQSTAIQNNTPSANEYTVTATVPGVTGVATITSAAFQVTIFPVHHDSVFVSGVNIGFYGGSIKATQNQGGFQVYSAEDTQIDHFYLEGFVTNGSPSLQSAIEAGGEMPETTITSSLAAGQTGLVSLADGSWFPSSTTDPQDEITTCQMFVMIAPADFQWGSTTASAYVTGVQQGQYEVACYGSIVGMNSVYITNRDLGNDGGYATTAPTGTVWPAGSKIGLIPGSFFDSGLVVSNTHINSIDTGSLAGFDPHCNDVGANICADFIAGSIATGFTVAPVGTTGNHGTTPFIALIDDSAFPGATAFLSQGQASLKITNNAAIASFNPGGNIGTPETSEIASNVYLANTYPLRLIPVQNGASTAVYSFYDPISGAVIKPGWFEQRVFDSSTVVGTNPNSTGVFGRQYGNSDCWYDVPPVGANPQYSQNRVCYTGGPSNSANGGWEYDVRNPTTGAWVNGFTLRNNNNASPNTTNAATATVDGNLNVTGAVGGAGFANFALTNQSNSFSAPQTIQGVAIGSLQNYLPYSYNLTFTSGGFGWKSLSGTAPTLTNPTDATNPTQNQITQFNVGTAVGAWAFSQSTPMNANTTYAVCAWLKGYAGGELVALSAGSGVIPAPFVMTTSWKYYCSSVVTGTTGANGLNVWAVLSLDTPSSIVSVAGVDVSDLGSGYVATNGTAITTSASGISVGGVLVNTAAASSAEGRQALTAGTATVTSSAASSTANFQLTNCGVGGTPGILSVGTITAGTSFVINSSSATDTSTVCWSIH